MTGGSKTTNTTQEVKLPEWLNKGGQQTFEAAQAAAAANPIKAYTGPTAAGSNANLDAAAAQGGGGFGQAQALTTAAANGTTGRVSTDDWNAARMQSYMNPSLEAVQGRTLDAMRRSNAEELAAMGDGMAGMKAYGGTRHAVLEAGTREGQSRNMLDYLAKSNSDAYDDAYSKFSTDRTSRQGAEATNAGLDQGDFMRMMQAGAQSAGLNTESLNNAIKAGAVQQSTEQGQVEGDYNEFLRMQDAPMQRYMQLMSMLSGAQTDKTVTGTETTKTSGGLLNSLLGGAGIAASIFSDRRLKRAIVKLGELASGLGIYAYRYAWSSQRHVGVMADEVRAIRPDAIERFAGFDMVDYGKLGG